MSLNKAFLIGQLGSLENQREHLLAQLAQVDGAARLCRSFIGMLERAEDAAANPQDSPQPEESNGR